MAPDRVVLITGMLVNSELLASPISYFSLQSAKERAATRIRESLGYGVDANAFYNEVISKVRNEIGHEVVALMGRGLLNRSKFSVMTACSLIEPGTEEHTRILNSGIINGEGLSLRIFVQSYGGVNYDGQDG